MRRRGGRDVAGHRFARLRRVCFTRAAVRALPLASAALAAALVVGAPRVDAASWLALDAPAPVAPGWLRAAGRYASDAAAPAFRALARCGTAPADVHVVDAVTHLAPDDGLLWLDVPAALPCAAPELSLEMVVGTEVVARAVVSRHALAAARESAPSPAEPARRLRVSGQRYASRVGPRTEAGLAWALDSHLSIQLSYARTAQVPLMPSASDDGILARLRFGF